MRQFANPVPNAPGCFLLIPIAENNLKVLKILLTRRFDGNWEEIAKARYLPTPLLAAVQTGNLDIVNLLISCGAPFADRELRLAASKGYIEIVELLLENGVRANADTLYVAVEEGHREIVELLLARGVETSPYVAAMTGDIGALKKYLEQGMDVDAKKSDRHQTLLQIAAGAGQKPTVEYLLCAGADLNACSWENLTPTALHAAVKNEHREIAALLLARGAKVKAIDSSLLRRNWQTNPLHWATSPEIAKLLLDAGADINAEDGNNSTPLHLSASRDDRSMVQYLIERGANIASRNKEGQTPLNVAPNREIAELLLANGADIDVGETIARTPLYEAAREGRQDVVELLVERSAGNLGRDINALLACYAGIGCLQVVELLIRNGADVNHQARKEFMPLHLAATNGHRDVAECLIDNGALLDAFGGQDGVAPLHCAVWESHLEVVQLLLERGANVNIKRTVEGR